jgi:hypothetical protein
MVNNAGDAGRDQPTTKSAGRSGNRMSQRPISTADPRRGQSAVSEKRRGGVHRTMRAVHAS